MKGEKNMVKRKNKNLILNDRTISLGILSRLPHTEFLLHLCGFLI